MSGKRETLKKIVLKIEDGMDPRDVLCTTYQMRNFYKQMHDGFFSVLDIMNYIQHHQIVKWCKNGSEVLDVCCGRGLLLPMLRYQRKDIKGYTGVDIKKENATFMRSRVTDGKELSEDYYPFPVSFVQSNVARMAKKLDKKFDFIVYTSAIEHMNKDHGVVSLQQCFKLLTKKGRLILTCPNTPEERSGYDTQYKAHVYEWKRSELITELDKAGFEVLHEYGVLISRKDLMQAVAGTQLEDTITKISEFIPSEWLLPVFAPLFPSVSKEIGFVCKRKEKGLFSKKG